MNETQLYQEYLSAMTEMKALMPEVLALQSALSQANLDVLKQAPKSVEYVEEIKPSPAYQEALAELQAAQPAISALADELRELNELIALFNTTPLTAKIR